MKGEENRYPFSLFECFKILKWEREEMIRHNINWKLYPFFVQFKEMDINWHYKDNIDKLQNYNRSGIPSPPNSLNLEEFKMRGLEHN